LGSRTGYADDRSTRSAPPPKGILRDYAETILVCVIFVIFSRAFVFQQSKIPSGSMMDTLLIGDYIMVNRFVYSPAPTALERAVLPVRDIRRGDVVVFKYPPEPEVDYIKRVAGLPGETVELRDGYLYVDGTRIDEPYVQPHYRDDAPEADRNFAPTVVPEDQYFMLGDHRNSSRDSRAWGFVHRDLVKGRALLIWYSFDEQPNSHRQSASKQVRGWADKIANFFTKSRFSRCFTLIR